MRPNNHHHHHPANPRGGNLPPNPSGQLLPAPTTTPPPHLPVPSPSGNTATTSGAVIRPGGSVLWRPKEPAGYPPLPPHAPSGGYHPAQQGSQQRFYHPNNNANNGSNNGGGYPRIHMNRRGGGYYPPPPSQPPPPHARPPMVPPTHHRSRSLDGNAGFNRQTHPQPQQPPSYHVSSSVHSSPASPHPIVQPSPPSASTTPPSGSFGWGQGLASRLEAATAPATPVAAVAVVAAATTTTETPAPVAAPAPKPQPVAPVPAKAEEAAPPRVKVEAEPSSEFDEERFLSPSATVKTEPTHSTPSLDTSKVEAEQPEEAEMPEEEQEEEQEEEEAAPRKPPAILRSLSSSSSAMDTIVTSSRAAKRKAQELINPSKPPPSTPSGGLGATKSPQETSLPGSKAKRQRLQQLQLQQAGASSSGGLAPALLATGTSLDNQTSIEQAFYTAQQEQISSDLRRAAIGASHRARRFPDEDDGLRHPFLARKSRDEFQSKARFGAPRASGSNRSLPLYATPAEAPGVRELDAFVAAHADACRAALRRRVWGKRNLALQVLASSFVLPESEHVIKRRAAEAAALLSAAQPASATDAEEALPQEIRKSHRGHRYPSRTNHPSDVVTSELEQETRLRELALAERRDLERQRNAAVLPECAPADNPGARTRAAGRRLTLDGAPPACRALAGGADCAALPAGAGLVPSPLGCNCARAVQWALSARQTWSDVEVCVFIEKFLEFPKDFRRIATFLTRKTTRDCIRFYYDCKKRCDLKAVLHEQHRRRRLAPIPSGSHFELVREASRKLGVLFTPQGQLLNPVEGSSELELNNGSWESLVARRAREGLEQAWCVDVMSPDALGPVKDLARREVEWLRDDQASLVWLTGKDVLSTLLNNTV